MDALYRPGADFPGLGRDLPVYLQIPWCGGLVRR